MLVKSGNIYYKRDEIQKFYRNHRISWDEFYKSEKEIIMKLNLSSGSSVLDIGCGCGGLGIALKQKFNVNKYTGIEINEEAAVVGNKLNPDAEIIAGDILELKNAQLDEKLYDVVFSLACIDFNIKFSDMLYAAWEHVVPEGHLLSTFRISNEASFNDISNSYQYINFNDRLEGERAPYVVFHINDLMNSLSGLNPSEINAYGYWGKPSKTAVTPCENICFTAFSLKKREPDDTSLTKINLELPKAIKNIIDM